MATAHLFFEHLPWDLLPEIMGFCGKEMAFVLDHVGVFKVSSAQLNYGKKCLCSWAAKQGALSLLKWAMERGCPWDEETSAAAAGGRPSQCA